MNIRIVRISLMIIFLFSGCMAIPTNSTPSLVTNVIKVASLKEYLPGALEQAREWKEDAYLVYASIPLYSKYQLMSLYFDSHVSKSEFLQVILLADGTVELETNSQQPEAYLGTPILFDEINIDSQEALDLLIDEKILTHLKNCRDVDCGGALLLERFIRIESQPTLWTLIIQNYNDGGDSSYKWHVDAFTGEKIFSTWTISLPTPTP